MVKPSAVLLCPIDKIVIYAVVYDYADYGNDLPKSYATQIFGKDALCKRKLCTKTPCSVFLLVGIYRRKSFSKDIIPLESKADSLVMDRQNEGSEDLLRKR